MKIHTNCRHYRTSEPCHPHKEGRVRCDACSEHAPIEERILVVKLDALGDVLRTTTCLEPLRQLYPRSHITWITRNNAVELLELNPWVDRILPVESNYLELLLSEDFDLAIGPDTDQLSASIVRLARAQSKRGFVSDRRGGVIPLNDAAKGWWLIGLDDTAKRENRQTYGEWLYAICELPTPVARPWLQPSREVLDSQARFLRNRAPNARHWVCFNTGGSRRWQEKRWKAEYYRELAQLISSDDPAYAVVLVGGPEEAEFNSTLLASYPGFIDAGTDNSVEDFAGLIMCCDWVLTPDSLGYHVACAVETPAVCLVGPTSPWELDLYGMNQVLHPDLKCIACYLANCPFAVTCMDHLTPKRVWPCLPERNAFEPGISALSAQNPPK